jgi:hypothetical protein
MLEGIGSCPEKVGARKVAHQTVTGNGGGSIRNGVPGMKKTRWSGSLIVH